MYHRNKIIFLISVLLFLGISCAKKGMPTGGPQDFVSPKVVMSQPDNKTIHFKDNEIHIYFDEYVTLKDLDKQLVISPPQKQKPLIRPLGGVSKKHITIQLKDTLQPNTTYSFNFGKSIVDATEGNSYNNLTYIFSTGDYIDSLQVKGKISDAVLHKMDNAASVFLYEVNATHNDSVIYIKNPRYVAAIDTAHQFMFDHVKAGTYQLVGLMDENANYRFDSAKEKIAFYSQPIQVPTSDSYDIKLFKEIPAFSASKPKQESGNKLYMGFKGDFKNSDVALFQNDKKIPSSYTKLESKDTLQIWYKPLTIDSVQVVIKKDTYNKKYSVRLKEKEKDSIQLHTSVNGILHFRDTLQLKSTTPIETYQSEKIRLFKKDSIPVLFTLKPSRSAHVLDVFFNKEPETTYKFRVLPDAITDFFEQKNTDTLSVSFQTKELSDYGNLTVVVAGAKRFPVLIQLTTDKGELIASQSIKTNQSLNFDALQANKYRLRAVYDDNANDIWDTGNYLQKSQPEEVIYFSKQIDVRMNWDVNQPFDLSLKP